MFNSILKQHALPKPKYGLGFCIALSLHVAALFWILGLPAQPPGQTQQGTEVLLYKTLPYATPSLLAPEQVPSSSLPLYPPSSLHSSLPQNVDAPPQELLPRELKKNKAKALTKPVETSAEKPLEEKPSASLEHGGSLTSPYTTEGGAEGGDTNSTNSTNATDSNAHPSIHGRPGFGGGSVGHHLDVIPFGEGMAPPVLLDDPLPIRFSREALEARVQGRVVVRCTITVEGNVKNCRFLQRLPHMDEAILSALYMRKYSPATYQGKKISVDYNIPIRLKVP